MELYCFIEVMYCVESDLYCTVPVPVLYCKVMPCCLFPSSRFLQAHGITCGLGWGFRLGISLGDFAGLGIWDFVGLNSAGIMF